MKLHRNYDRISVPKNKEVIDKYKPTNLITVSLEIGFPGCCESKLVFITNIGGVAVSECDTDVIYEHIEELGLEHYNEVTSRMSSTYASFNCNVGNIGNRKIHLEKEIKRRNKIIKEQNENLDVLNKALDCFK